MRKIFVFVAHLQEVAELLSGGALVGHLDSSEVDEVLVHGTVVSRRSLVSEYFMIKKR